MTHCQCLKKKYKLRFGAMLKIDFAMSKCVKYMHQSIVRLKELRDLLI